MQFGQCENDELSKRMLTSTKRGNNLNLKSHWQSIRECLERLGGVQYRAAIDRLETVCMDPEAEEHYTGLLEQWKKDEDNVKDLLEGIGSDMNNVMKRLDEITSEG